LQIHNDFAHKNHEKNRVHGHHISMNHCTRSIFAPEQVKIFLQSLTVLASVFVDPSVLSWWYKLIRSDPFVLVCSLIIYGVTIYNYSQTYLK